MTNITRDNPTGTATFVAPSAAGVNGNGLQLSNYAGNDITSTAQEPLPQLLGKWISPRQRGSLGYSLTLLDWRGGMNRLRDQVETGHTRIKDLASLEVHYRRTGSLPPATLQQSGNAPTGTLKRLSSYVQLGRLFMGIGSNGNHALTGEGINSPTLTDVTYTPPGDILCMEPIFMGSAPTTERVFFGFLGANPRMYNTSLTSPGSGTAMDASLSSCYGMITTELNGNLMLFLTATGMKTLARANADTDVAQTVLSNIPNPSKAIGLIKAAGGVIRAYWVWNNQVMHTDAEGGTPERLDLTLGPIVDATKHRDGLAATDGNRVIYYNGRVFEDTYWQTSRSAPPAGMVLRCMNLASNGTELVALVMWIDPTGVQSNVMWEESYSRELKAWYPRGLQQSIGAGVIPLGMAKSPDPQLVVGGSGYIHVKPSAGLWNSRYFPAQTQDPMTYVGISRAPEGLASSPALLLPDPITYAPKTGDRIYYGGTMPAGADVTVYVEDEDGSNTISWTFRDPLSPQDRLKVFEKNQSRILNPVVRVRMHPGSDPTQSPNCLPITVDFSAFLPAIEKKSWIGWR